MKDIRIGIIGGTGGIGRWFADLFRAEGYPVHVTGRKTELTVPELVKLCPVVIVSVPINVTGDVIRQAGPLLEPDALLMDLTSLKEEPVREMLAASASEVIGCHPLFGPDVPSLFGQNIVICPARGRRWLQWLTETLKRKGGRIVETTPRRHDEMMAVIQALNHINTITLGLTLRELGADPKELESFSTPIFRTKTQLLEKVFAANPGLYADIIMGNPDSPSVIRAYEDIVVKLKEMVMKRDGAGLRNWMKPEKTT